MPPLPPCCVNSYPSEKQESGCVIPIRKQRALSSRDGTPRHEERLDVVHVSDVVKCILYSPGGTHIVEITLTSSRQVPG